MLALDSRVLVQLARLLEHAMPPLVVERLVGVLVISTLVRRVDENEDRDDSSDEGVGQEVGHIDHLIPGQVGELAEDVVDVHKRQRPVQSSTGALSESAKDPRS